MRIVAHDLFYAPFFQPGTKQDINTTKPSGTPYMYQGAKEPGRKNLQVGVGCSLHVCRDE